MLCRARWRNTHPYQSQPNPGNQPPFPSCICVKWAKNGNPYHRESLFPLLAPFDGLVVPGGHDGLPLCERGDAPLLLPEVVREDLGLVVVRPLLEVGALLVGLGVLDLVVRVDRVQDVGGEFAAAATEPRDN